MFDVRKVPYVPVLQVVMDDNAELVEWTGRRNAPVAVYNDEPAEDGWLEITYMAERYGSGPSLFPEPLDTSHHAPPSVDLFSMAAQVPTGLEPLNCNRN